MSSTGHCLLFSLCTFQYLTFRILRNLSSINNFSFECYFTFELTVKHFSDLLQEFSNIQINKRFLCAVKYLTLHKILRIGSAVRWFFDPNQQRSKAEKDGGSPPSKIKILFHGLQICRNINSVFKVLPAHFSMSTYIIFFFILFYKQRVYIFLFNYIAQDNTNKKSQFTMQFGPA